MRTARVGDEPVWLDRVVVFLAVLVCWMVAAAEPGLASVWLQFAPKQARPGVVVSARTVGRGALAVAAGAALPAFLAPIDGADPLDEDDPRLIPLGLLDVDEDGNGAFTFRVPSLDEGRYGAWILCETCAPSSGGRRILPVGSFVVVDSVRTSSGSSWILVGTLATLGVVGVGLIALSVQRNRRASS